MVVTADTVPDTAVASAGVATETVDAGGEAAGVPGLQDVSIKNKITSPSPHFSAGEKFGLTGVFLIAGFLDNLPDRHFQSGVEPGVVSNDLLDSPDRVRCEIMGGLILALNP